MLDLLQASIDMDGNYDKRKIERVEPLENGGIGVSTAWTTDCGYETALLDDNGVHPVERYPDRESTVKGHKKWVKFTKNYQEGDTITKLGWGDLTTNKEITLKRLS